MNQHNPEDYVYVKYKGKIPKIEELLKNYIKLKLDPDNPESIFAGRVESLEEKIVLLNHALFLKDLPSLGLIVPASGDISEIKASKKLSMHPLVFDYMVERRIITKTGKFKGFSQSGKL